MMSRLFFILTFFYTIVHAADLEQVFAQANALYGKKEYDRALELYQSMEPKSSVVWFNMGNCMYKKRDYEQAYIFWLCAQDHADEALSADINYNIAAIEKKLDEINQENDSAKDFLSKYGSLFSLFILQILFLSAWFTLIFYFIKMSKHGRKYKPVLGCLMVTTVILAGLLVIQYQSRLNRPAIVTHKDVAFFAGPHTQYHQLGTLKKSSRVRVKQTTEGWAKVVHKNKVGWVAADSIAIV